MYFQVKDIGKIKWPVDKELFPIREDSNEDLTAADADLQNMAKPEDDSREPRTSPSLPDIVEPGTDTLQFITFG